MKKYKLAILGDSATQLISKNLINEGIKSNFDFDIYESSYDQIESEIRNLNSGLYKFSPDGVLIFISVEKFQEYYYSAPMEGRSRFFSKVSSNLENFATLLKARMPSSKIFITNLAEISDGIYGNNSNKYAESLLNNIRRINVFMMDLSQNESNVFILDMAALQSIHGRNTLFDPRMFIQASLVLVGDGISMFSRELIGMINSTIGGAKKCLILDLDNTVWGGVIGDDGVEKIEIGSLGIGKAFSRLQKWAKQLQLRGILLAVCSKNIEEVAKAPFELHPDMVLRLEDISIFVANWNDKASNIKFIQSNLNIGFDSMVFIDDNPFERELVRKALPLVCVPELPEDPADYVDFLAGLNLFEPGILSALDSDRTKMIQKEIERNNLKNQFSDESEFLKSIQMIGKFENFNSFNTPRVAQLSERSNQYNLRTLRYSESDVQAISLASDQVGMAISLRDDLGDHGLISVIVLKLNQDELFIENWFMSCRVLKRGVEYLVLNKIVDNAKKLNCKMVTGEYIPTLKNTLVKDHFQDLGFTFNQDGKWSLNVEGYSPRDHHIKEQ
jgi:FkbH-like protein